MYPFNAPLVPHAPVEDYNYCEVIEGAVAT